MRTHGDDVRSRVAHDNDYAMPLNDPEKIDFIGVSPAGDCVLTIADDTDWGDEATHIAQLQAKLNTYMAFIESGEIDRAYADATDRPRRVVLALRHAPPAKAVEFLTAAKQRLGAQDVTLSWQLFTL